MDQLTTAWMWPVDDGINALRIDVDGKILKWYDAIGCACSDDDLSMAQTISEFQTNGAPNNVQFVPADVLDEINETLKLL